MILFYSGSTTVDNTPEHVLAHKNPGIMLTYWEMDGEGKNYDTRRRFANHCKRRKKEKKERKKNA